MLTSPSDSLPQIVCPMDEHAIPSNSFCSAPPHSEPPPPLLPLSSITPSGAKNGTSGHRRSSRIQEIRAQTLQKESIDKDRVAETPSPKKRQIESVNMGSQSKQPRVEDSHVHESQKEAGFDSCAAECQNKQKQQKSLQEEPNISAAENTVEQFAVDAAQTADSTKSDMETCSRLAVAHAFEDASAPKGWVIGPLFQSLKMKMATFTEIVMSPVKLFRANSPPLCTDHPDELEELELHAGGAAEVENSEPSATFLTEAQSENRNLEAEANQPGHSREDAVALKCSKILSFDVELPTHSFTQAGECAIKDSENASVSVKSSVLSQPSVDVSASHVGAMEDQKCNVTFRRKPLPGKCTENRSGVQKVPSNTSAAKDKKEECEVSDEQCPLMDLVKSHKADAQSDCPLPDGGGEDGRQIESLVCVNDNANGGALKLSSDTLQLNPETFSAAGLGRAKREVELDCHPQNSVKRKRLTEDTCAGDPKRHELLNVDSDSGMLRSPIKGVVSTDPIVNGNLEAEGNQPGHSQEDSVALTCSKNSLFDVELPMHSSTQAGERAVKEKNSPVSVPLQHCHSPCIETEDASVSVKSSVLSQPSVDVSASHVGAMEDQKFNMTLRRKPPPGKCTENRSGVKKVPSKTSAAKVKKEECEVNDEQFPLMDLVRSNKADAQKRKRVVPTDPIIDVKDALMPAGKRPLVSTRANKKGKGGQEIQSALNTQTDGSSEAMLVCSLDKISGESENNQKGISSKAKPGALCKRLKTRTGVGGPGLTIDNDGLALETSVAITSTKQAEQEALAELLRRPAIKPLQSTSKRRNISTKPLKRKSQALESDSILFSTSSVTSAEPLDLLPTNLNTSKEISKKRLNEPSKRAKKGFKNAVQSSTSGGNQDIKQCLSNLHLTAKENKPEEGKDELSVDSVYFEMTPFESIQPVPSLSQPILECYVQLDKDIKLVASNNSSERVSGLRSGSRRVNNKPRRDDNQRRKCRVLQSRTREADEVTNSVSLNDADLSTGSSRSAGSGSSRRLMRSYSCPEIPSFRPHDTPWTSSVHSPHHSRIHPPRHLQFSHSPPVQLAHKSLPRARRHTVCSVEVEREIAPLCLRKEVYPTRRSLPFDRASQHFPPSLTLSASTSLSALASCFLSSPLAFLSKKTESRGASSSPSTSSHVTSPTSSSSMYPKIFLQRIDSSSTSTVDYSSSTNLMECEIERRLSEEDDDGEDTSSSSQELEDVTLREEKALSDSEIKVVQKHKERGKVSSIKIRRTLPKAQNNLTPMGLPKLVRLNKKEFSLEEIYTNKNFTKAPESRLETIFEVPLKHRNGSESWFGQRRFKRFLEFLDSSKVRKPKKQLVGVGKSGVSSSRTRRGGFPKDEPQDLDSLLCAKLSQLNLWVTLHQTDS